MIVLNKYVKSTKKEYSCNDKFIYRLNMEKKGIVAYSHISILRRVVGYLLVGYGITTFILPSGSQLALLCGCSLLGIPFKLVWSRLKHYGKKILFVLCVLSSWKRLKYEIRRRFL